MSIKTKILVLLSSIAVLFTLILAFYTPNQTEELAKAMLKKDAEFISQLLAENLALGMQTKDLDDGAALAQALNILKGDTTLKDQVQTIYNVQIFDANRELVKSLQKDAKSPKLSKAVTKLEFDEDEEHIQAYLPMKDQQGTVLGYLIIEYAKQYLITQTNEARTFTMIMSVLILAGSLILGYYIVNSIVKSIRKVINAAERVAQGDLNVVIDIKSKDETQLLGNALSQTISTLKDLISEIKYINDANSEGHLDKRGDAFKFQGAYSEIVSGINNSMDSIIAPLNVAAEYIDRIAKGDIPPKIVDQYNGDFNEIKNNLNQCIDSMNAMTSMLTNTIDEQVAGDVDARCDADLLQGTYRELMLGVNQTLDSVLTPTTEAIGIMNQYASGDLRKEMRVLPGKQIVLTNGLNNIRKNVFALVEDASKLSSAAIEGRLDFRADASKHQGDFRQIIEGFNGTLDAVIHPMNVAAEYIDRISKGDIPPKITDKFNGDFNAIITNLNQCIDSLNLMANTLQITIDDQTVGMINTRCDTSQLNGIYRELMNGVNTALDTVLVPISDAVTVLNLYANGDLSSMFRDLPGLQIALTNSINNIRANVLALISDANLLSTAAIAGNLDTRAESSKHQGDFKKIIEGFNGTLDAVIRPLNVSAEYIDRISKGDIPPKITDDFKGDFNAIKNNLNQCIDAVTLLVNDATMLSSSAIAGDLTKRAGIDNHQGDYRKLVIEMNQLMNAIAEPIEETSRILYEMSLNNYDENYSKEYQGIWNKMKESTEGAKGRVKNAIRVAVNISNGDLSDYNDLKSIGKRSENDQLVPTFIKLIENIQVMINIMIDNTEAQKAGDLDAFAKAGDLKGEYVKLIAGYNEGMRVHINNVLAVVELLNKYAEGDLQEEMPLLPGKQSVLSNCINKLRLNVLELISDSTMLSKAAVEGKLDTRADVTKHQGDFRKIVEGVNDTLDAIIHPLNVSAEYMDRIAKGDIPPKIVDEYRGDFNEIKNNLNQCIDSINLLITDADGLAQAAIIGDVKKRADISKHTGDYRKIIQGFNNTLDAVIAPIEETVNILELMANGDLSHTMKGDFKGDHAVLKQALNGTLVSINELLNQVTETVDQVLTGSSQVAEASQNLSSGASEQAAAIEQMSSSMMQIAAQTKQNADNAMNANKLADDSQKSSERGFNEMQQLQTAMNDINESSKSIAKIIKVIDEIAFQTNLLALNAAVEAARAGVHGQGFAVVAEEVRNLARRSAEAAKETADLIEGSIKKVSIGNNLSEKTAGVLNDIREQSTIVAGIIRQIATASNEQAEGINQIEIGFSQIDKVTQRNTAGAEQSASAAEELASQAQMLTEMLNNFELLNLQSNRQLGGATHKRKALKSKDKRLKYFDEISNNRSNDSYEHTDVDFYDD